MGQRFYKGSALAERQLQTARSRTDFPEAVTQECETGAVAPVLVCSVTGHARHETAVTHWRNGDHDGAKTVNRQGYPRRPWTLPDLG